MASALPMHLRKLIVEEKSNGKKLIAISEQHHLSYSTVRNIFKRYRQQGEAGLIPCYVNCGPPHRSDRQTLIYRAALWLKRCHRAWGAALIRLALNERYARGEVPSERTLQRWFKAAGLCKVKSVFPAWAGRWATAVHDTWQVDAKEQLLLGAGQKACYLTVVDEKSGSLLNAFVFPPLSFK